MLMSAGHDRQSGRDADTPDKEEAVGASAGATGTNAPADAG